MVRIVEFNPDKVRATFGPGSLGTAQRSTGKLLLTSESEPESRVPDCPLRGRLGQVATLWEQSHTVARLRGTGHPAVPMESVHCELMAGTTGAWLRASFLSVPV